MGGGGGKGGGQKSQQVTEIPAWLAEPTKRNLARAEQIQQLEYQPWTGLDVAAQTPMQQAANQMTANAAGAFGMLPQGFDANAGMPQAQTIGGATGYSGFPMYEAALAEANQLDPQSAEIRKKLYGQDLNYSPGATS